MSKHYALVIDKDDTENNNLAAPSSGKMKAFDKNNNNRNRRNRSSLTEPSQDDDDDDDNDEKQDIIDDLGDNNNDRFDDATVFHSLTAPDSLLNTTSVALQSSPSALPPPSSSSSSSSSWWQIFLYTNLLPDAEQWTLNCCCCYYCCCCYKSSWCRWLFCCCCCCSSGRQSPQQQQQEQQQQEQQQQQQQQQYHSHRHHEPCVLLEGVGTIRFVKFVLVTLLSIMAMHGIIRWLGLENKESYTIWDMIQYDLPSILMDCSLFFMVGRLYSKPGVDHMAFVGVSALASLYTSGLTTMSFLQHSVSLYDMHCFWPWSLWIFVSILIPLILTIIIWHVRHVVQQGRFWMKLVEMTLTIALFLLPNATSPHFHFHHWFAGWLIGMHRNFDTWWSRATMAWCWGQYINGIAVYGRDPLLTCGYAYYLSSQALQCDYLKCYYEEQRHHHHHPNITHNETNDDIPPIPAPDWRHCTR